MNKRREGDKSKVRKLIANVAKKSLEVIKIKEIFNKL